MRLLKYTLPGRPFFKLGNKWLGFRMRIGWTPRGYTNTHHKKMVYIQRHLLVKLPLRTRFKNAWFLATHPEGKPAEATARLSIKVFRGDGTVEDYGVVSKRVVTTAFAKRLAAQMAANFSGADNWKYHDAGTDNTAENVADTALNTPYGGARSVGTQVDASSGANGVYESVATIAFAGSFALKEHAIFNAAAVGVMLDRSVHATINVGATDSVQYTYDLTITAGG